MEATHWWGPHTGFWIVPLVFMIVMCLLVGLVARRTGGWRCGVGRMVPWRGGWREGRSEAPREILDRRYASGEITREEYEQVRRDLEGEGRSA